MLNYIGGEWVEGTSEISNINPSDLGDVIANHALADSNQAIQAIDAAHAALSSWKNTNPQTHEQHTDKDTKTDKQVL